MFSVDIKNECGTVEVATTMNRGHTPEELAAFAVDKIIPVSYTHLTLPTKRIV